MKAGQLRDSDAPFFHIWKPITLEHINVEGEEPLTFNRKKDLQDYCAKHKLRSGALGNDA